MGSSTHYQVLRFAVSSNQQNPVYFEVIASGHWQALANAKASENWRFFQIV